MAKVFRMPDVNGPLPQKFPLFLSSLCRRAPGLEDLRARIYRDVGRERFIYVDEQFKKRDTFQQDDLCAADELIARVRQADTFICILAGSSHGTPIRIGGSLSNASFFEIELFQAALLQKKVYAFVRQDFVPEPRLEALLGILKNEFSEWRALSPLTEDEIFDGVMRIADETVGGRPKWPRPALRAAINRFVQALYTARTGSNHNPSILFLHGATDPSLKVPRIYLLQTLGQVIAEEPNEEKRLSRLWLGLRELMGLDHQALRDPSILKFWNQLLAEWARAGAWYGLHADMPLGCLAALNSMVQVRDRLNRFIPAANQGSETEFPGGALASAKYSIAKRLYVKLDRIRRFNEALCDIDRSLQEKQQDKSGLLAVRGSILRQLGRRSESIADYETVLQIRRENHASHHQIGEALSELGYAYLWYWSPRKGLRFCEEGVERLRDGGTQAGFLARGLRKLAVAYLVNGRLRAAHRARQESKAVAVAHGALDQV